MNLYKTPLLFFCLLISLCFQGNLSATVWNWLDDTAIRYFSAEDLELMMSAKDTALDNHKDGDVYDWKNLKTGVSGSVTPLATAIKKGMTCRKTRFINNANGIKGDSVFVFCKYPDNKWKVYTK